MKPIKLLRYGLSGWIPGGSRECVLCGHRVWRFMPYRGGFRGATALVRAIDMVGSDLEAFECPRCGSHDRERHLFLYMRAKGLLSGVRGSTVVHFAPETRLSKRIAQAEPARYVRCDLYPSHPDVERVDLLDMPFADDSVDILIANHVLEHVRDDVRALTEISRVVANGGLAILQTPYSRMLQHTWEDSGIIDPNARLQAFGQEDHVRLYGRDIFERFAVGRLVAEIGNHATSLADTDADRLGVNPDEPLFLYRKRG